MRQLKRFNFKGPIKKKGFSYLGDVGVGLI